MELKIVNLILYFSLLIVMFSVVLAFIRMMIGPALSDRVVALDLTANLLISLIAIFTIITNQPVYIDVVIALSLVVFLTTVAFANLIEWHSSLKRRKKRKKIL